MSAKFSSEIELAELVCKWLIDNGWEVYKEVHTPGGDIDIVAVMGEVVWAIECKLTLNHKLLEQALMRKPHAHYVSVAVPHKDGRRDYVTTYFLRQHGLGLIDVGRGREYRIRYTTGEIAREHHCGIEEKIKPRVQRSPLERTKHAKKITRLKASLTEAHKSLIAGAPGGGQLTPYKVTIMRLREYLARVGKASIREIVEEVSHHYWSPSAARAGIARAMLNFEEGFKQTREGKTVYWELDQT